MSIEYEIKILGISKENAIKDVARLGLNRHDEVHFKRYIYEIQDRPHAWIRLRTDGIKTTLSYKNFKKDVIDGMEEVEIIVDDIDTTNTFLEAVGFKATKYQENKRLLFSNDSIEISIDEWPNIPAYIEIEGKDQKVVEEYISKLGYKDQKKSSKPTSAIYEMNGLDINSYKILKF